MPPDTRKTRRSPTEPYFRAGQVRTVDDLSGALQTAGETIELNVLRGTDERSIQVAFGQNSQPEGEA